MKGRGPQFPVTRCNLLAKREDSQILVKDTTETGLVGLLSRGSTWRAGGWGGGPCRVLSPKAQSDEQQKGSTAFGQVTSLCLADHLKDF